MRRQVCIVTARLRPAVDLCLKLLVLATLSSLSSCGSGDSLHRELNSSGRVESEGRLSARGREGVWVTYFDSGRLFSVEVYESGVLSGPFAGWHSNGQLRVSGEYRAGKLSGRFVEFYQSGQMFTLGTFVDGKETGLWQRWHENGVLRESGEFRGGVAVGVWEGRDENGNIESTFDHGNGGN